MQSYKITGNIEGVPFIMIQKTDLYKWHGFYINDTESKYPDLLIENNGFKIFEGDDFDKPLTHWGKVISKSLNENCSPCIVNLPGFEVVLLDPTYYTAWESYDFWIGQNSLNTYFILNTRTDFINPENFNPNCLEVMKPEHSLKIELKSTDYRILASTEHGLDENNTIFSDICLKPGNYSIGLFVENKEYPGVVVYQFTNFLIIINQ
jgi:hypothetical protein